MAAERELNFTSAAAWEATLESRVELNEGQDLSIGPFTAESVVDAKSTVSRCFSDAIRAELLSEPTIRAEDADGTLVHWVDVSPRNCGFASSGSRLVVVEPKLPMVNWLGLLALANRWGDASTADLAGGDHPDFFLLIVDAYTRSLEALTDKGLRRWFDERDETLTGRVRGRLMLGRYASSCASGRPDRAPCRFPVLDFDNLPNRTLRWALLLARRLLATVRSGGPDRDPHADGLDAKIASLDARLEGIPQERLTTGNLRPLEKLPAAFAHYGPALSLARLLIERLILRDAPGESSSMSFVFSMPDLFEDAMEAALGDDWLPQYQHVYEVEGSDSMERTFRPDFWHAERPAIIDAKWKYAFQPADPCEADTVSRLRSSDRGQPPPDLETPLGLSLARIRHADVFQLVTYCHIRGALDAHHRIAKGLLIYPAEGATDRIMPTRLILVKPQGRAVEVALMPWPIGRSSAQSIWRAAEVLRAAVLAFLEGPTVRDAPVVHD